MAWPVVVVVSDVAFDYVSHIISGLALTDVKIGIQILLYPSVKRLVDWVRSSSSRGIPVGRCSGTRHGAYDEENTSDFTGLQNPFDSL